MPPHSRSSTVAVTESTFVEAFPFIARRQRQCDILVFERYRGDSPTRNATSTGLFLLKNPQLTKGDVKNLEDWNRVKVATLREPRSLAFADISKNGFNDSKIDIFNPLCHEGSFMLLVIVVDAVEHSDTSAAVLSRISWLENTGTNATGWKRREIGRCPGVKTVKVGHFTNTFSLQVLVVQDTISISQQSRPDLTSLMMFTQPINITSRPPWPSSMVSIKEKVPEEIVDICVVRPSNMDGELDKILIMSELSVSLVWWEHGKWNTQNISTHINYRASRLLSLDTRPKSIVCAGGVKEYGMIEFIVYSMSFSPSMLVVCLPSSSTQGLHLQDIVWELEILDNFSPNIITNIQSVEIDGMNGFAVSVAPSDSSKRSQKEGQLYFYYPDSNFRKGFGRSSIAEGGVLDFTVGAFKSGNKSDVIALTKPVTNQIKNNADSNEITLYSLFNIQFIKASICPSRSNGLVLRAPDPSTIGENKHEMVLFSTFSKEFSLVILGPGQVHDLPPSAAVKVLRGVVELKQQYQHAVRRPYLTHSRGISTQSLEANSHSLKAGMRGAIFIQLAEEKSIRGLRIKNYSPALLRWAEVPSSNEFFGTQVFTLDGFHLLVDGTDIAHVHFTAFQDRTSINGRIPVPILIPGPHSLYSRGFSPSGAICQVRCCIKNSSKRGGMYHSNESCVSSQTTTRTDSRKAIPNAWLLPDLTESRPLWHVDDKGKPVIIDGVVSYPPIYGWLSDIEQALRKKGTAAVYDSNNRGHSTREMEQGDNSFDVWMDVDFTPCVSGDSDEGTQIGVSSRSDRKQMRLISNRSSKRSPPLFSLPPLAMALPTIDMKFSEESPITPEVLQKTASKINVQIPDNLVEDYTAALTASQHAMEIITAMDDCIPIPDLNRFPRKDVHFLPREKNHLNGWAWKVTIKDTEEERAIHGLLYGKTICLKDNVCVADVPCLNGTTVFSDWVPKTDATLVTRILEAGGMITGKATAENLSAFGVSNTSIYGPVGNPYDATRSAGGSSSGTAVLVATSQVDMGIGADQGGSIRLPAAHVGIVGLKPTFGLVPYTGVVSNEFSIDHVGPMTRDVLTNALLLQAIAGVDGIDDRQGYGVPLPSQVPEYYSLLQSARQAKSLLVVADNSFPVGAHDGTNYTNGGSTVVREGVRKMRIGILKEGGEITGMDPRVFECVKNAAKKFEELGADVLEVSVPGHLTASLIARVHRFSQANNLLGRANGRRQLYLTDYSSLLLPWNQEKFDRVFPNTANIMLSGLYAEEHYPTIHGKCHNLFRKLRMDYDEAFQTVDVLVMPTTPWVAKVLLPREAKPLAHFSEANGLTYNTQPFDDSGHPAISIPCGFLSPPEGPDTLKLPVGMQLVAKHFDELTLYKASLAWSDAFNWKEL
ncbi:hypothetical protein Clacol_007686 [Clathrus columnatus]|uniref:Amidase n=1 Tax=Clathrus columnatus TaxID=1419009 RepID=A0AAV5AI51_9AGAM|nr:hypothetical protein Clacol_007686 [Clathrus columnatus]